MKKIVLNYGLLAGSVLGGAILISMLFGSDGKMDMKTGEWIGYISMIVALSSIFFGVRAYRDKESGGVISFGKAFQVGILISLVASVIYVAVWMLYVNFGGGGDFMEQYYQYSVEQLKQSGKSAADIEREILQMEQFKEMYKSPLVQIGITFLEIFPVGLIISLLSAVLLKKGSGKGTQGAQVLDA
ncbi:MAG: DUF4199 domain-containing protein [Saprospiraceae bacterium]|nr:DUF4199 domain-containing protein [Saprospiraceae bacterium]